MYNFSYFSQGCFCIWLESNSSHSTVQNLLVPVTIYLGNLYMYQIFKVNINFMSEIIINIPDEKLPFKLELIKSYYFVFRLPSQLNPAINVPDEKLPVRLVDKKLLICFQAFYIAGSCNLDKANGAYHPTTGTVYCMYCIKL